MSWSNHPKATVIDPSRPNTRTRLHLLERVTPGSICAELGVFRGDFSVAILNICRPSLLYLVDTFDGHVVSGNQDGENLIRQDMGLIPDMLRFFFMGKPYEIVKACSWEWLESLRPESLDFVYIDTSHEYESTMKELSAARRAVRKDGLICGHDYDWLSFPGVVGAVNQFAQEFDLKPEIYRGDKLASYLIINK